MNNTAIVSQDNYKSAIILSGFYTLLGSFVYMSTTNVFTIFLIGSTNIIGVLINVFSMKEIRVYVDRVEATKLITKRILIYRKKDIYFSNTSNGMYSFGRKPGFTIKRRTDESNIGLILLKTETEENKLLEKLRLEGYSYKKT